MASRLILRVHSQRQAATRFAEPFEQKKPSPIGEGWELAVQQSQLAALEIRRRRRREKANAVMPPTRGRGPGTALGTDQS